MNLPVYHWMRKHGIDNIIFTVLSLHASAESLNRAEITAIERHKTHVAFGGLNVTLGGDGGTGFKHSSETRARMAASHTGKKQSAETVAKRLESRKGYVYPAEARARMSASLTGRKLAPEHRAKLSKKLTAEDATEIRRLVSTGSLQREVAVQFGVSHSMVSNIVTGKKWT